MNVKDLHAITGNTRYSDRKSALLARLSDFDLDRPHVLAQILAQVLHESGAFRYVEEIASGAAYEGRTDLGNIIAGDGVRFKGRDLIQCTGRSNYRALTRWVRSIQGRGPDFEAQPQLLTKPEWIGISVVWYFRTRAGLMGYCDAGNIEMVTRRVNGGLNGYADRLEWFDKVALHMLGHGSIREAQEALGVVVDGISGPVTRRAMHEALRAMEPPVMKADHATEPAGVLAAILALFARILGGGK